MAGSAAKYAPLGCCALDFFVVLFAGVFLIALLSGKNSSSTPTSATPTGSAEKTTAVLPQAVVDRIKNNKPTYEKAAAKENVAWQMLAAAHYREGSNDPDKSGPSGEKPGTVNIDSEKIECYTFEECEIVRAKILKRKAETYNAKLDLNSSEEIIKNTFLAYNRGVMYKRAGCTWNDSPYVMNQFDEAHKNMRWPANDCEVIPPKTSTYGKVNVPYGAFTVYSYLVNNGI